MSNLQLIEELCYLVERQIRLVRNLSEKLAQVESLDDAEREAVKGVEDAYSRIIGADELPDDIPI